MNWLQKIFFKEIEYHPTFNSRASHSHNDCGIRTRREFRFSMTKDIECCECLEAKEFHKKIQTNIKVNLKYHLKYHHWLGELVWLVTKQVPTTIKFAFTWSWFRTYCGQFSFRQLIRPIAGWKLGWDIAYYCNEVW